MFAPYAISRMHAYCAAISRMHPQWLLTISRACIRRYEEGMPLLNLSTFSTNVSVVEESDLERAIASFEVPVVDAPKGLAAAADGA